MNGILYVAMGGAIGASCRYSLGLGFGLVLAPSKANAFPWATLSANVLGGLLMGFLMGWLAFKISGAENIRLFVGVGILGGFTTFSSFSLETIRMIETKAYGMAMGYISASVILSVLAVFIGLVIARKIFVL
ncbi:MAG: fluoride efflux transporter CrcB [Robiginitomaculum sp.]|nr:MAG: fluoride efflux transporter CrcB [Robiginitomaculum sp.]